MGKKCVLRINRNRCKGCRLCIDVCPKKNLGVSSLFNKMGYHYVEQAEEDGCTGCRKCAIICPDAAIELYIEEE